jgi:hypothetical protein
MPLQYCIGVINEKDTSCSNETCDIVSKIKL